MTRTIFFILIFWSVTTTNLLCQENSDTRLYVSNRIGYFNATFKISADSTFQYYESNHRGQKIKDSGKLIHKADGYYLNSKTKTRRTSKNDKNKSKPFYKFSMQKIDYNADFIVIFPCDSVLPEYCTFKRTTK
jgi:hypothetical protein